MWIFFFQLNLLPPYSLRWQGMNFLSTKILPSQNPNHSFLRIFSVRDVQEVVRVSEKVGVHLQERPALQNKSWQNDFRQVHSNSNLKQIIVKIMAMIIVISIPSLQF